MINLGIFPGILAGLVYLFMAFLFIRAYSYTAPMAGEGEYNYTFLSIVFGLFFPITLLIQTIWRKHNGF